MGRPLLVLQPFPLLYLLTRLRRLLAGVDRFLGPPSALQYDLVVVVCQRVTPADVPLLFPDNLGAGWALQPSCVVLKQF